MVPVARLRALGAGERRIIRLQEAEERGEPPEVDFASVADQDIREWLDGAVLESREPAGGLPTQRLRQVCGLTTGQMAAVEAEYNRYPVSQWAFLAFFARRTNADVVAWAANQGELHHFTAPQEPMMEEHQALLDLALTEPEEPESNTSVLGEAVLGEAVLGD